jgi:hypothetical protein
VEDGFSDNNLGNIQPGDLISSFGYRVFSNHDLVAAFGPSDPSPDYGLDALFVVTDTEAPKPPPRILTGNLTANSIHLAWEGDGSVFQVESAPTLLGPWTPVSPITPDSTWDTPVDISPGSAEFYRLRQW